MLQNPFIPQNKAGSAILRRVSNNQVEVHMRLCSSHQQQYTILTTVKAEAKQYKNASKTGAILKVMEKNINNGAIPAATSNGTKLYISIHINRKCEH